MNSELECYGGCYEDCYGDCSGTVLSSMIDPDFDENMKSKTQEWKTYLFWPHSLKNGQCYPTVLSKQILHFNEKQNL